MSKNKHKEPTIVPSITIEQMAAEGKSLGHLPDGRVVFVPYTAPGDVVDVRLGRRRKAYAEGVVEQMVTPSPIRVKPLCEHFGVCGGCKWQHIPYEMQLETKGKQVYDQLERIGHLEVEHKHLALGASKIYHYRNKLEFTFSNRRWLTTEEVESQEEFSHDEDAMKALGFHIPGRFDRVLDIQHCYLQDEISDRIRLFVREHCLHAGYSFYDLKEQHGLMRTLIIRTSSTGELMVIVVFGEEDPEKIEQLLTALRDAFPVIISLQYVINLKHNDTIGDQEVILFHGRDYILEEMEGLRFRVGPKSFYQTNSEQARHLYEVARSFAGLTGEELVYDLYTGTGTIACFVARSAKQVIGIEYVPEAIEDAKLNAETNQLSNTRFYAGDMKDVLTQSFIEEHGKPDVVITDPPRAGMHPDVVKVLLEVAPERIVYVSCNPASQARDVAMMSEMYRVVEAQPVDMFPHTGHVENVLLIRKQ
ncbi:MAG: 23S rRNA (uracil(1939)-C(5))-methyltransferase RlmD [Porphyromonas sp.]|nr:23S rRNA (uracil(1939)-C(5))-methyltransferase RlmD [Porphyromonas sp.]